MSAEVMHGGIVAAAPARTSTSDRCLSCTTTVAAKAICMPPRMYWMQARGLHLWRHRQFHGTSNKASKDARSIKFCLAHTQLRRPRQSGQPCAWIASVAHRSRSIGQVCSKGAWASGRLLACLGLPRRILLSGASKHAQHPHGIPIQQLQLLGCLRLHLHAMRALAVGAASWGLADSLQGRSD